MKHTKQQVDAARESFDAILHTPSYREIHGDDDHLEALIGLIDVGDKARLLDLGTGDGYVAFEMARRWPSRSIVGVDIANEAVARNNTKAAELGSSNAAFHAYEGVWLPLQNRDFDGVTCRYAFHHCPEPRVTVSEMSRVLKPHGIVVLSDPIPSPLDEEGFIDEFQRLKPDGHMRFHPQQVLIGMFDAEGFDLVDSFESSVRFPRTVDARYEALLEGTPDSVRDAYEIEIDGDRVMITVTVVNALYARRASG